ncbi:MAG: cupredoxin family copper-binding protein [Vicinamibacterales bacterium]
MFAAPVALALLWAAGCRSVTSAPVQPETHSVSIDAVLFQPAELSVKVGDVIVWVNKDPFPHTVTSSTGGFDSQSIAPGASWQMAVKTPGEFPYTCSFHPVMKGVLRVNRP